MSLESILERTRRCVALLLIADGDEQYIGTGVLVSIGGREFILTAGHNVWSKEHNAPYQLSVGTPSADVSAYARPGDGSVARIHVSPPRLNADPEPDVAAIEVGERAVLLPSRTPFEERAIGFFATDAAPRRLIMSGFPSERAIAHRRIDLGDLGRRTPIDFALVNMVVHSMAGRRAANEPAAGRGIHVYVSPQGTDPLSETGGSVTVPATHGMSGGPLVLPDADGVLIGLARSRALFEKGHDQWCEPAVEAVRLLVNHESDDVAAAARRIVARCDL